MKGDPTRFLFRFETDGALTAQQVLAKALEILEERLAQVAEGTETAS